MEDDPREREEVRVAAHDVVEAHWDETGRPRTVENLNAMIEQVEERAAAGLANGNAKDAREAALSSLRYLVSRRKEQG